MAPEEIKLEELKDSTAGSLTAGEKSVLLELQRNNEDALVEAAKSVVINDSGNTISDFIQELSNAAKTAAPNRSDMTITEKQALVKKFAKETNVLGVNLGQGSELIALAQIPLKPLKGADGIIGVHTFQTLLDWNVAEEKPIETVVTKREAIGTPLLTNEIDSNIVLQDIKTTNLQIDPNCVGCITEGIKDGYVYKKTDTIARVNSLVYNKTDSTITIRGNSGEDSLTISVDGLYHTDEKGHGAYFDHDTFASRVIDKLQKHQDKKKEEKQALANQKSEETMQESRNEGIKLRNKYNSIKNATEQAVNQFNAEKIGGIMATYDRNQSKGWENGRFNNSQINRGLIADMHKTLSIQKAKLEELKTSTDKIPLDVSLIRTSLQKDIAILIPKIDAAIEKAKRLGNFIDVSGQDKEDVLIRESYINGQSGESLLRDPSIIEGTRAVIKKLKNSQDTVAESNDNDRGGTFAQQAYNEGITRLNNAIVAANKRMKQVKDRINSIT